MKGLENALFNNLNCIPEYILECGSCKVAAVTFATFLLAQTTQHEALLNTTEVANMRVRQMHNLCVEIYKNLGNMNPPYIWELFDKSSSGYCTRRPYDRAVPRVNQTLFDSRSIKFNGARL